MNSSSRSNLMAAPNTADARLIKTTRNLSPRLVYRIESHLDRRPADAFSRGSLPPSDERVSDRSLSLSYNYLLCHTSSGPTRACGPRFAFCRNGDDGSVQQRSRWSCSTGPHLTPELEVRAGNPRVFSHRSEAGRVVAKHTVIPFPTSLTKPC